MHTQTPPCAKEILTSVQLKEIRKPKNRKKTKAQLSSPAPSQHSARAACGFRDRGAKAMAGLAAVWK